jgi:hypothetical protein
VVRQFEVGESVAGVQVDSHTGPPLLVDRGEQLI